MENAERVALHAVSLSDLTTSSSDSCSQNLVALK